MKYYYNSLSTLIGTGQKKIASLLLFLLFTVLSANAQVTVTNPGNTTPALSATYGSLAAAIADVNSTTAISGPVTIKLDPASNQTAPVGGYAITVSTASCTGLSATNKFVFDGGGNTITAFTPQAAGVLGDAIFKLVGADFVTIQNFVMQENAANTTTAAASNNMTEFGIALFYSSLTNGAQNNTIQNNTISLNRSYSNTFGVFSTTRTNTTALTTAAEATTAAGANSGNKVYSNAISNVGFGIAFIGSTTAAAMDNGNDVGGSSAGTANTLTNWGGLVSGAASAYPSLTTSSVGIFMINQINDNVSYNSVTSATNITTLTTTQILGILKNYGAQPTGTITASYNNNTVTLSNAATTSQMSGVSLQGLTGLSTATFNCNNNNVLNCAITGSATSATMLGIFTTCAPGTFNITGNTVRGFTSTATSGAFAGIQQQTNGVITALNINNNNIGDGTTGAVTFSNANSGSTVGIAIVSSGAASTCTVSVSSNTIRGIVYNGAATGSLTAISNAANASVFNANSNTITNITYPTTSSTFTGIANSGTTNLSVNIGSNNINNLTIGGTSTSHAMISVGSPAGTTNVTNNTIQNISATSAAAGTLRGIVGTTPVGLYTVTGNTIDGLSYTNVASTGSITGIYNLSSATLENFNNNIIRNFSTPTTGTLNGIQNNTTTGTFQCKNNQIYNFSTTAGGVGGFTANGITWSNSSVDISGNLVYAIKSTGTTGGTGGTIIGISNGGTANIYNNAIYDLASNSTGAVVTGISLGGSANCYNNLIGDLRAPNSTSNTAIAGINSAGGTTNNISHNTVNIAATTTSATTFGSSAIYFSSSSPINNVRNNIFVNTSSPGPTGGFSAAIRYTAAPTSTNFPAGNNNNFYYAGTAAANRVLYGEGSTGAATNGQQTIAAYKTYINTTLPVAGRESASVSEAPNFVSTTGSNPITNFLKYDTTIITQIEQGGVTGTGITTDFSGTTVRCPGGSCPGAGANPDRGAWELNGITPAPTLSINSVTPSATTQCAATARTVSVTANTLSGTITGVVLNYTLNGAAQSPVTMTNTSGSIWTGVIPAATPVNANVAWSVTATNSLSMTSTLSGTAYQDEPLFGFTPTASANPATICAGGSTVLTADLLKGANVAAASIGNSSNLTSATTQPTAFCNRWPSYRMEMIFTAAELSASGLIAGNITAMTFNTTTLGDGATNANFVVKIGNTSLSTLTTFVSTATGFTTVFPSATYTHTASGLQTIPFSTPFVWDGTSNIIVEMIHSGANSTNNAITFYTPTTGNTVAYTSTSSSDSASLTPNRLNTIFTGKVGASGTTVSWTDGTNNYSGNGISVTPAGPTTYTATISVAGCSTTAATTITPLALPSAPTATNGSRCAEGVVTGATVASTTGAATPTFKWYAAATGGTALQSSTSTSYTTPVSTTTTFYVTETNGTCESSPRTPITLTIVPPPAILINSTESLTRCGTGPFTADITASSTDDPAMTYSWSVLSGPGTITSGTAGSTITYSLSASTIFRVTSTPVANPSCATITKDVTVSVFPLPLAALNTDVNGVCAGGGAAHLTSNLNAGNFSSAPIPFAALTAPADAVTLAVNGTTPAGSPAPQTFPGNTFSAFDDGGWADIPMGFNFNFFGTTYDKINVGTNGTLQFGTFNANNGDTAPRGLSDFLFTTLPSTTEPFNMIAVLAMDNDLSTRYATDGGTVKYWTEGTAPNRKFVVSYIAVRRWSTSLVSTYSTAQAIFYETTGIVEVHVTGSNNTDANKLIGINNSNGTIGALAFASGTTATATNPISTPIAYRFSPPVNYTTTWSASTTPPFTDPATFTTFATGTNLFNQTVNPTVSTRYALSYTNQTTGCTNALFSSTVQIDIINNVAPVATAVSDVSSICLNGSANLSLTGNVNSIGNTDSLTYQWQVSTDNGGTWTDISGATSATATVTPTVASSYRALVRACAGTAVPSNPVSVGFTNIIDSSAGATRCGTGTVSLTATTPSAGASIKWYAAATGGTALFTGSPYTPTISTTTTYYVAAETTGPACSSARVAVTATVTTPPAINLTGGSSTTICNGSTATLTTDANANYDTFNVTPNTGTYTSGGVFTFTPTATTVYTVTANQSSGSLCGTTFTYTVNVNTTPVFANASASIICTGSSVTLNGTTITSAAGNANTGGAGTSTIGGDNGNPYRSGNGTGNQIRTQLLVKASELTAAGMVAGNITSLAFTTTSSSTGTLANFTIAMGHTSATALTSTFETSSLTPVFSAASFTPASSGLNVHTFSTPFNWDGTSNLLINICQTNDISGTSTVVTESPGFNAMIHKADSTTSCATATGTVMTSRPIMQFGAQVGSVGPGGATYAWTSTPSGFTATGATVTATPTVTTTYHVVATSTTTGCASTPADVTVTTQNSSAQITTPPAPLTKCIGNTAAFTVAATGVNLTYQWRRGTTNLTNGGSISGATTATLTITGLVAGDAADYNVVVSSDCGAPVTSSDARLTLVTPVANINASATTICAGSSVTLTENGGTANSWSWSPGGATTNVITVTPATTTTYTVTATVSSGCSTTANVTITVNPFPTATTVTPTAGGNNIPGNTICDGTVIALTATGGIVTTSTATAVGPVSNAIGASASNNFAIGSFYNIFDVLQATTLSTVDIFPTDAIGTSASIIIANSSGTTLTTIPYVTTVTGGAMQTVTINYPMVVGTGYRIGQGTVTNLQRNSGGVVFPYTSSVANITGSNNGASYYYFYNMVFGESASSQAPITWTATPATTLYTDAQATAGHEYVPGTPTTIVYARPSVATTYTATATNGACPNQGSTTVNVTALPSFTVSDKVLCTDAGGVVVSPVGGDSANTYIWSPTGGLSGGNIAVDGTSTNIDVITANPSSTASYSVTANNNTTGCVSTPHSFTVTVNPQAIAAASTPATRIKSPGTTTTFTVTSTNAVAYQWQVNDGSGFVDIDGSYLPVGTESYSGATTATLTINDIDELMSGFTYRAKVKGAGNCAFVTPDNSQEGVLTVQNIGFVANFPASVTLCESGDASFHIQTTGGTPENYIWQVSENGGPFTNITDGFDSATGFTYSGATTADLDITGITYSTNSYRYQVSIDDESVTSDFAALNVNKTVTGTQAPQSNVSLCSLASTSSFTAKATGTISGVTWEYGTSASGPWTTVANGTPSNITYSSTLPAAATTDGERTATLSITSNGTTPVTGGPYFYRATFLSTNGVCPNFTTTSGQLDITTPVLSSQPASTSVIVTNSATFTVGISGPATYQWQYSTSPSSGFQDIPTGVQTGASYSGATSATLTVTTSGTTPLVATNYYRVRVTSGGCIVYSNAAQLTVTNYCAPTYATGPGTGDQITRVVLGTLTNNSGASSTPFYTFYSSVTVPDLIKLSTNSVQVTMGSNSAQYAAVWIDFNQNGTFEASEGVVSSTSAGANGTATLSVTIPSTATLGQTRLRVRGGDNSALLTSQACGASNSIVGETEDYLVNIIATPAPAITSFGASTACAGTNITINGTNMYGAVASGVTVNGVPVSSIVSNTGSVLVATLDYTTPAATGTNLVSVTAVGGTTPSSPTFTVNAAPSAVTVSGGGNTCAASVTLTASNGGSGTMYYQGITSNGTSTTTASGSQAVTASGTYYFRAQSATGGCWSPQGSAGVTFYALPSAITVTPAAPNACSGAITALAATGGTNPTVSSTIGSGTSYTSNTGEQTAFNNRRRNYVGQTIYTAAELLAAGVRPGNISSLAYNIGNGSGNDNGSATTNANFTVKIGAVGSQVTFASTAFLSNSAYTTVFGPATYTHAQPGWQVITFTTPFVWNGTDNICVDVRMDGIDSTYNATTQYTTTTGSNTALYGYNTPTSGTLSTSKFNIQLGYDTPNPFTWSPTTDLYTDSGATTPYTGTAANTVYAKRTSTGTYTVTATNPGGCSSTKDVTVTVDVLAGSAITTTGSRCAGGNFTATANRTGGGAPFHYAWNDGVGGTYADAATVTVNKPAGTYNFDVTITDNCGGTVHSTATIVVNALPVITLTPTPANARICGTGSVSIAASSAVGFTWSPSTDLTPTTGSPVVANPSTTTTYTATTVADANGCVNSASQTVTVGPAVNTPVVTTPVTVCSGSTATLSAAGTTTPALGYTVAPTTFGLLTPTGTPTVLCSGGTNNVTTNYTSNASSLDDGIWDNIALPFPFKFYGVSNSTIRISTNGNVQFGPKLTGTGADGSYNWTPATIPTAGNVDNFIGCPWMDHDPSSSPYGTIRYFTNGTAPNRKFVISYESVKVYQISDLNTAQIILNESDNTVEIHLGGGGLAAGTVNKVMGIEGPGGTLGTTPPGRNFGMWQTTANEAWKFTQQSLNYSWTGSNGFTSSLQNPTTPALTAPASYSVIATEGISGCSSAAANVSVNIQSPPNAGTNGTLTICSGTTVTASQLFAQLTGSPQAGGTWSPALAGAGTYTYTVAATSPCTIAATSQVVVTAVSCAATQLSNCGNIPVLTSVNTRIFAANTITTATLYRFRVAKSTAPTTYYYAETTYPSFRLTDVVGLTPTYGTTYNVDIQNEFLISGNTVTSAFGPMCTVTTQAATNITVPTNQCGQTLAAINSKIYVNGVTGATMYTYRIAKQSAPTQYGYIETPYSNFRLTAPLTSGSVAIEHNTVYLVSVSVTTANGSSNFNGECQITTPAGPMTTIQASQCGDDETPYVIPTKSTKVYATDFVSGATYTFKLEQYDGSTLLATKYATSPINYFDCNMFTGINSLLPNTNYHVYVAINYYGTGEYDHDCVIKTPAALKQEDLVSDFKAVAYPNPFANTFLIDVKSSSQASVNLKVYDMIGRLIEQRDVRVSDLETTTLGDRYPSGVYNVVVSQESSVQTVRVVKR